MTAVKMSYLKSIDEDYIHTQKKLTSAVGLDVGDTEGSLLGLVDGDFDGLWDGCEMRMMWREEGQKILVNVWDDGCEGRVYTGTKEVLTSFVGEVLGPTVGLDDGCSKDREQKISIVSSVMLKYPQKVKR